ncbi:helix-turn-helix domain-containing protein [Actinoallomurus acaciae]|uniref:Helix-turn-helix domain-containing protein n=1 Tax=Actinoallomurus acaciae TaxID=502577 RepID=A0ABV5YTI9_9ACTN
MLRRIVGARLRRLRESAGISREEAGAAIYASLSKISRMELGRVGFKQRDVNDLLALYGVRDDILRHQILELAVQSNQPGWWHQYSEVISQWFEPYLGLEEAAARIHQYAVQFVPSLLRTEEYARAVDRLHHPDAPEGEFDRRAALLRQRKRVLTRDVPPTLLAVIDEAALRRPIGGKSVMRKQIEDLIEACEQPHITIQVVPLTCHAVAGAAFSVLGFTEPELSDVVYLEQLISALYLDKQEDANHYLAAMERLRADIEPASATPDTLARLLYNLADRNQQDPASNARRSPIDRPGQDVRSGDDDRIAADIYRQARDHAIHSPALIYDVERGLRRLQECLDDDHQDPR